MNSATRIAMFAAFIAATPQALDAQLFSTPKGLALAGANVGIARGQDALLLNPANLALPGGPRWSIALPSAVLGATLWGPGIGDFAKLAQGEDDPEERAALLAMVPDAGVRITGDVRIPVAALQIGPMAFSASYGGSIDQSLGRDVVELILDGFEEGRTDYTTGNTVGGRGTYLDFAAGYGRAVGPVTLGATAHYLKGRTISRSRVFDPRFVGDDIEIDYADVSSEGGSGYALDLGVAAQPLEKLTVSASISGAIGSMSWSDELTVREVTLAGDDFGEGFEEIPDRFGDSERPLTEADRLELRELGIGLTENATVPRVARVGLGFRPFNATQLSASFQEELAAGTLSHGWTRSMGVAVDQKIFSAMAVRGGFASNMDGLSLISGGFSLGPFNFAAARLSGTTDGYKESGVIFTLGTVISRH